MTHASEKMDIMDTITKIRKQKPILVSRPLAVFLILLFILALVATGLLVYYLTPRHVSEHRIISCNSSISNLGLQAASESNTVLRNVSLEKPDERTTEDEVILSFTEPITENSGAVIIDDSPRLPSSVVPISYDIYLLPFIFEGNFTFHGNVSIHVSVVEDTTNITLHADELEIDDRSVQVLKTGAEDVEVPIREISNDTKRNFLIIHLNESLSAGDACVIKIKFIGILNDLLQGFYRSSYMVNKSKRWIAVTQFQPTDARRAFPCFDEPALKATFQINIGRMKHMSTISNMPLLRTSPIEGLNDYVWDQYFKSVPMSTYLVAFLVSDLKKAENGTFSVWTRESALKQAKFSLQIGPSILKYYEDFFQIKFPLPKIDMVALPDFSTGAMENWGLITYRESVLLYEEGVSTRTNLQSIAIVVAHELAHQWFGNLVTPSWWSDLWLNEGFASYMEYLGANAVCPELKTLDQFVVQELQNVFHLDALKSSHQISLQVNNPDEINYIFDRISYGKGATIIRMMENFLTSGVFRRGLTNYLEERKYSNAEQDDLWSALTEQAYAENVFESNMTVKEIMDTWTLQTGFPVVHAKQEGDKIILKQERFLVTGNLDEYNTSLWWIPITYTSKYNNTIGKVWMRAEPELKIDGNFARDAWLLLNVNQTGYYRVNYDVRNWQLITEELRKPSGFKKFDSKNRAQFIDDAMNLASAGYLDYEIALNVTRYLIYEREYVPWKAAFNAFDFLYGIFSHSSQFDKYKNYILHLLDGLYTDVTFKEKIDDPTLKVYIRVEMLWRACLLGHFKCMQDSISEFRNWRHIPNPDRFNSISPNLRSIVYCTAVKIGSDDEWNFIWQRYLNTDVGSEKELLMSGLGCSREPWILYRYLEWAITEGSGIRKQDSVRVFSAVSSSIIGQHITYSFLKANWDKIKKYTGSSVMIFTGIIRECITTYPTQEELNDIKRFVRSKAHDLSVAFRVIQQLIEQGEANLEWKNRNYDKIVKWLTSFRS